MTLVSTFFITGTPFNPFYSPYQKLISPFALRHFGSFGTVWKSTAMIISIYSMCLLVLLTLTIELSSLRPLTIRGSRIKVYEASGEFCIGWFDILPLFSGLQLDTLTVFNREMDFSNEKKNAVIILGYLPILTSKTKHNLGWMQGIALHFSCPLILTWENARIVCRGDDGTFEIHPHLRNSQLAA
jgi:hypothetical protein